MNIEIIILQIVVISCVAILLRSRNNPGWSLVSAGILFVVAIGWFTKALWTPWLALGLWSVAIGFPIVCMNRITKLVAQEKFYQAHRISKIVRVFHPGDGWWNYTTTLKAQGLAQSGDLKSALIILEPMQRRDTYDGRLAISLVHSLQSKWYEYLSFAETQLTPAQRSQENSSAGLYIRSLGETRQINELLLAVRDCHLQTRVSGNLALVLLSKLYAFAFTGQVDNVRVLFQTSLKDYSITNQQFWIATAQWYAGNFELAIPLFQQLQQYPSSSLRSALAWRSQQSPLRSPEMLNLESHVILSRLQKNQEEDLKYNPRNPTTIKQAPLTYTIIAINCLIFILPFLLLYGWAMRLQREPDLTNIGVRLAESMIAIYDWGALMPNQFFSGSWWQPLTAMFLHDPTSIMHILFNMLGLVVVGTFVESKLGSFRFAIAYFLSGLGSMGFVAVLAEMTGSGTMTAIGASGAIMGMVGVMAAIYWQGSQRGDQVARQWLQTIVFIVVLQTTFDALNPNVSMTGHLSGFILGAIVGLVLNKTNKINKTTIASAD